MDKKLNWKNKNKFAACTEAPWKTLVKKEGRGDILAQIRAESQEIYGETFDECPKRKVCFLKTCLGRPLPIKSKTFKPYLDELKKTHTIKNGELFITNCDSCSLQKSCTSACGQVLDWTKRYYSPKLDTVSIEDVSESEFKQTESIRGPLTGLTIPWDVLEKQQKDTVYKYLYEHKDFYTISKELNLSTKENAKYNFYTALTKLSEYGTLRKFLKDKANLLKEHEKNILTSIYNNNKLVTEVAEELGVSKQYISKVLNNIYAKYNIKWQIFVRKINGKRIYDIPRILL